MNEHFDPSPKATDTQLQTTTQIGGALPAADRADTVLQILREHPLVVEALDLLKEKLPSNLQYHDRQHTLNVLEATVRLAVKDGLSEDDITLLAIAAAWHDTGFIDQFASNEPFGAKRARKAMERRGMPEAEIRDVVDAILDTQLKADLERKTLVQQATGRLSPWLLDADLSNFGCRDFFAFSMKVYGELAGRPIESIADFKDEPGKMYIASTIRLVANHRWHTAAAREELEPEKQRTIGRLAVFLANLTGGSEQSQKRSWDDLTPAA